MVDAGTICSVVCMLSAVTLLGGILGVGQEQFSTCTRRIDVLIELGLLIVAVLTLIANSVSPSRGPFTNDNRSPTMNAVVALGVSIGVVCIAVTILVVLILLVGINNHCEITISTTGLVFLWIFVGLNMLFAVPILLYGAAALVLVGPLVYFEYKRRQQYRRSKNIAVQRLGKPEGWSEFAKLYAGQYRFQCRDMLILYVIFHFSWEITYEESNRCAELKMRCSVCEYPYLRKESVFVDPTTFLHLHSECLERHREALSPPEGQVQLMHWMALSTKLREIYPEKYEPEKTPRFFEQDGLFKAAIEKAEKEAAALNAADNPDVGNEEGGADEPDEDLEQD